jgi:hypothetical protein
MARRPDYDPDRVELHLSPGALAHLRGLAEEANFMRPNDWKANPDLVSIAADLAYHRLRGDMSNDRAEGLLRIEPDALRLRTCQRSLSNWRRNAR